MSTLRTDSHRPRVRNALFRAVAALAAAGLIVAAACRQDAGQQAPAAPNAPAAPSVAELGFTPPEPGTYGLPPIQPAADGAVLDAAGRPHRLHDHLGEDYVLLSFIYTRCSMTRGCPFATRVFQQVQRAVETDPEVHGRLRLVTLSFDPAFDTPATMAGYAADAGVAGAGDPAWSFLTTASAADLAPILDGYGQFLVREVDAKGSYTGGISHALKVFLIDPERRVRNIYSSDFLHPSLVVNDVRTLLLEAASA